MTNEQIQPDPNFDYNTWLEQGQNAISSLLARKTELETELANVMTQIKEVGKTIGAKKAGVQRFRIKPLITKVLVGKQSMPISGIVAAIKQMKEGATDLQITSALHRYVNEFENVTIKDGSVFIG